MGWFFCGGEGEWHDHHDYSKQFIEISSSHPHSEVGAVCTSHFPREDARVQDQEVLPTQLRRSSCQSGCGGRALCV